MAHGARMNRPSWYGAARGPVNEAPEQAAAAEPSALTPTLAREAQERAQEQLDHPAGVDLDLGGHGHPGREAHLLTVHLDPRALQAETREVGEAPSFQGDRIARHRRDATADAAVAREEKGLDLHLRRLPRPHESDVPVFD